LIDNPEVFDASYEETVAYGNEWLLKRLRQGDETFYLGAFEERLIGMIGFRREGGIKTQHKGHIPGLYVLPESRGKGVGKALVQELLVQTKQLAGLEQLHLGVDTRSTPAFQLYRSLGFEVYGTTPRAVKLDGKYRDEALMIFILHSCRSAFP
jgi:ribosomal protein S18 acetylase RimI-like enzyme